jgi:TetR/AcrR family tetracycline transcriptional repressor
MPLSREEIVRTAIELLDRVGLERLSLRRLAAELGVSAPTLYWHVEDKRHLLDLMVEGIYGSANVRPRPDPGQLWWEWLAANARAQRTALLGCQDAPLVVAGNRPTENFIPHIEETLASLVAVGFTPPDALRAVIAIGNYVVGDALESQLIRSRSPHPRDAAFAQRIRAGEAPTLREAAAGVFLSGSLDQVFEMGLLALIDGLRRQVEATRLYREEPEQVAVGLPGPDQG